jgi:hypothetical protein
LDGRLRGLCGGEQRAGASSFFGDVGRDQGATGRPKSGLERRFSLAEVGCANEAEAGIGGGGMRGSYAINDSLTPIPESLIECGDFDCAWRGARWPREGREWAFLGVTVSPVVVVLPDNGRVGEKGRDVEGLNVGTAAR